MRFKEKIASFFYGRYGADHLYKFHLIVLVVLVVLSMILGYIDGMAWVARIISLLSTALMVYMFYRMLSRNIPARQAENNRYLALRGKVTGWFALQKRRFKERKTHSFKKCPNCKKTVRLKKVKGKHTVRCPLCSGTFKVKF